MRIGIDARIAHYARGGISNYVLHLLRALAALDGETPYCVLCSRKARHPPRPGPNFAAIPCWTPSHHRLERWALGAEIARLRLDLLHSPDFIPPSWGYRHAVITVHDLNFLYDPRFLSAESRRYYNRQIAWAVRHADAILTDSQATRADLIARLGTPAAKITVAPLAAGPGFRPLPAGEVEQVCGRYGLRPGYIMFVGTLERRKNVPGLLHAYRLLMDGGTSGTALVIVGGRGSLPEPIEALVEKLHLQSRVCFLHSVPDADLPALYNGAAVLVLPSFYEGFGLPVLEAMACGTPVVAADRTSLPEVVGEAGLLVDPDEPGQIARALAQVLTDEALRTRLREAGLARAARFTWERTARITRAVYWRVLGLETGPTDEDPVSDPPTAVSA